MEFSIYVDAIALVIIGVLTLFHYEKINKRIRRYQLFSLCLLLTAGTLVTDIISLITIGNVVAYPLWLNILINSIYFILI